SCVAPAGRSTPPSRANCICQRRGRARLVGRRQREERTMSNARHEILRRLTELSDHFSGRLGIAARHLGTGEELAVHADESFPTASSIKIAVLIELYRQAQAGELSLRERQKYTVRDRTLGSGLMSDLDEGLEPTLR